MKTAEICKKISAEILVATKGEVCRIEPINAETPWKIGNSNGRKLSSPKIGRGIRKSNPVSMNCFTTKVVCANLKLSASLRLKKSVGI